jgi:hypothetical protein
MRAQELLQAATDTQSQRGNQYGYDKKEERSAADIAALFNLKTGHNLTEADAWQFMVCLKEVRLKRQLENGGDTTDTLIDLISYTALHAESLTRE